MIMVAKAHTGRGLAARLAFLPEPVRLFAKRRVFELTGTLFLAGAAALSIALASYDSLDISFNNATGQAPVNLLGAAGATIADIALQSFGVVAILPVLALLAWGTRLVRHRAVPRFGWRVLGLLIAVCAFAFALHHAPAFSAWPIRAGLGGTFGDLTFPAAAAWTSGFGIPAMAVAATAGFFGAVLTFLALGLTRNEWRSMGLGAARALRFGARGATLGAGWSARRSAGAARQSAEGVRQFIAARTAERREPSLVPGSTPTRVAPPRLSTPKPAGNGDDNDQDDDVDAQEAAPRVAPRAPKPKASKRAEAAKQRKFDLPSPNGDYEFPPLDLLEEPDEAARVVGRAKDDSLEANARMLESVLQDFGVHGEIVQVRPGPVVTLYELEPAPGTKTSRVIGLAGDIARSMSAVSVRIAVVPGQNVIGIELPNVSREIVYLRELLASNTFEKHNAGLSLALGKDIGGQPVMVDLARMPHLLIAGTTGSGKSVGVNSMIASLLYRLRPEECRFIMIDPKMLELSVYDGIPHLMAPVVTDPKKAVVALKWVVREMENRYRSMSKLGVRNVAGYNQRVAEARKKGEILSRKVQTGFDEETGKPVFEEEPLDMSALPFIVVVIDEMADLMLVAGKDVEAAIQRLAQMARAAGIHLILATQRPSVDVITGTIKANLPTRISFQVTTKIDSRTILGEQGAEQLLGQGDMLYMAGGGRITRVHGPFLADTEVEDLVAFLKAQGEPEYVDAVTEDEGAADGIPGFEPSGDGESSGDDLYDQAVALVAREQKASTSFIQRHLRIGYNRAATLIEQLENDGVVSQANHVGKREVLVSDHSH
ncbi:MAG: DNA translocase FtsK 4TM domain-containing protein [Proteobacteria bacterium]|nr:DNA translocase FtsK 4TM domain-containing protein [Pseudomonadota bacterium]